MTRQAAVVLSVLVLLGITLPAHAQPFTAVPHQPISWLSTGDSFSSGEGISGSGVGADYCAQSRDAYGPRALQLLQSQRSYRVAISAFTACTGHLTGDFYNEHQVAQGAGSGKGSLWQWTQEKGQAGTNATFGGNDIGFGSLITDCIDLEIPPDSWEQVRSGGPDGCRPTKAELLARVDSLIAGQPSEPLGWHYGPKDTQYTMAGFYTLIAQQRVKPGGVLIVAGYPRLVAPSSRWPAWRGSLCQRIWASDADMLGTVTEYLDEKLENAVDEARIQLTQGRSIRYVSRLNIFDADGGHSLCSPTGSEWLNGVSIGSSSGFRKEHSFHPNERGHQRTAEVVAEFADEELQLPEPVGTQAPAPVTVTKPSVAAPSTAKPPIRDPAARYEVGSDFDASCVNAWPTAPTYTTTSIILTMSCPSVPRQFLFVQVAYPDPDLPITPSTGTVRVRGKVMDVARSAYGFTQLVVTADRVDIRR